MLQVSKSRVARAGGVALVGEDGVVLAGGVALGEADVVLVVDGVHQEGEEALVADSAVADLVVVDGVHQEDAAAEGAVSVAAAGFNKWVWRCGCCTSLFAISFRSRVRHQAMKRLYWRRVIFQVDKDRATMEVYSGHLTTSTT